MSSFTARLNLKRNDGPDPFLRSDFTDNIDKLDAAPGIHICLSTTRPTWGAGQAGRHIYETNTGLIWLWTGTAFVRGHALGRLAGAGTSGTISATSTTTPVNCVTLSGVTIPGGRWIIGVLSWLRVQNSTGQTYVSFRRDGSLLKEWLVAGDSTSPAPGAQGASGTLVFFQNQAAGVYAFQFAIRTTSTGGTSTVESSSLDIVEV